MDCYYEYCAENKKPAIAGFLNQAVLT